MVCAYDHVQTAARRHAAEVFQTAAAERAKQLLLSGAGSCETAAAGQAKQLLVSKRNSCS